MMTALDPGERGTGSHIRPLRVLLADDEPIARDGLRELVGAEDLFEVCGEASDGRMAVEAIRRERPDIVMLDIQMPELDGFGVLAELPEGDRPVIVFVTAYEQYAVRIELFADDFALLGGEEIALGNKSENDVKELRTFTDLVFSKNKPPEMANWKAYPRPTAHAIWEAASRIR